MNERRERPYLSVVVSSRNDEHGGDTLRRMQVFISGLLEQLEKFHVDSELILVDWNPPPDKPLVKDVIRWPDGLKYCTIRAIIVPPEIHRRYKYSDKLAFRTTIALNCGIRRARGEFILPAGIDLLYSDELMAFISARRLKENERYRIDRRDVERDVVQCETLAEQLDYCREHVIRVKIRPRPVSWYARWRYGRLPVLHTSAAGDFQLMSRSYWHKIRGFREGETGMDEHVDGLLCYMAHAAGTKEVLLSEPLRLYHIDHGEKHGDRTKRAALPLEKYLRLSFLPDKLNEGIIYWYGRILVFFGYTPKALSYDGVPTLGFLEYRKMAREMLSGKRPYACNDENWGLGSEKLEENIISRAGWDK